MFTSRYTLRRVEYKQVCDIILLVQAELDNEHTFVILKERDCRLVKENQRGVCSKSSKQQGKQCTETEIN